MERDGLLGLLCGYFELQISLYDLLMFALGSFGVISLLLLYYSRIPKSNLPKETIESPIYQSKDILLQSKIEDANYLTVEKSPSILVKGLIYVMILVVVFTPLYKLLGIQYFL